MEVDYNKFSKTFSKSRKSMKWEEIDYFLDKYFLTSLKTSVEPHPSPLLRGEGGEKKKKISILDVWCWSGRLLSHIWEKHDISELNYAGVDLSSGMLEEARENFPDKDFFELNMLDLGNIKAKWEFDYVFFIASFHHLEFVDDRLDVIKKAIKLLRPGWIMFMTNWALDSDFNYKKYTDSIVEWSENEFWSTDFNIYIWEYPRFYHCFALEELEFLFEKAWFDIVENREFSNKKNYISIIKKPMIL